DVHSSTRLDAEGRHTLGNLARTLDSSGRPDKACEEAVTGRVVLDALPAGEGVPDDRVRRADDFGPRAITDLGLRSRGVDDVREEDGYEQGRDRTARLEPGEPANDVHLGLALQPRATGEAVDPRVGHERRDELGFLDLGGCVPLPDDERG